jgi:hypothetical protein
MRNWKDQPFTALILAALWIITTARPALAQAPEPSASTLREQARDWNIRAEPVIVSLSTGKTLKGRIVQVDSEAFLLRQKNGPDTTVQYASVTRIRKQGGVRKAILIPAIVGGAAVVVLCAAPYPIGFLCRRDPS